MDTDFQYIIVGAGSTGASISYYLSEMTKDILLLDRSGVAQGNTGKSSALIRTYYSNEIIASMAKYSYGVISNFDSIGFSGFHPVGMIFPFSDREEYVARQNTEMLIGLGLPEKEIDPDEVKRYFPSIDTDDFDYIVFEDWSGYADPVAVTNSFIERARSRGTSVQLNKFVTRVDSEGGKVSVESNDGNTVTAKKVILATNVWTNELLANSGIPKERLLPITASLHSVVYLRRPAELQGVKPVLWDPPNLAYYKMEGDTLCALGSLDPEIDKKQVDIGKPLPEVAEYEFIEDYLSRLVRRIPLMGGATVVSSITGLYDMTPDGQAIVSPLDYIGLDNVYVCAGLSGHGFKLAPAYGLMTSEMATGVEGSDATFDWRLFSPRRFSDGRPIRSKFEGIGTIY